jgi:hypothetical protein
MYVERVRRHFDNFLGRGTFNGRAVEGVIKEVFEG